jgi:hypothetical protein
MRCVGICAGPAVEGFAEHKALGENEDLASKGGPKSIKFEPQFPLGAICQPAVFLIPALPGTNGRLVRWEAAGRPFPPPRARPVI